MRHLFSKDLGIIFLLTTIYVIVVSFPNINYTNHMNLIFFIASFLFSGYSLVALLRPEEDYKELFKKPVLILEFSVLLTLIISVLLRFSSLGLHLKTLVLVLSVFIMVFSISAYIRRINYYKSNEYLETPSKPEIEVESPIEEVLLDETSEKNEIQSEKTVEVPEKEINEKPSQHGVYLDLILIAILSAFVIISYLIQPLNIRIVHYYLGLVYMLFLTGYTMTYIFFPVGNELKLKIRLLLSFGISFPVTSIIGLPLYYSKYGFTSVSMLIPLAVLTLFLSVYAYKRRSNA